MPRKPTTKRPPSRASTRTRPKAVANGASSGAARPAQWLIDWVRSSDSDSGVAVNGNTSLMIATVWQAVNVISGDVGQLPLHLFRRSNRGRERATEHPSYGLLRRRPNPAMGAMVFKELLQSHALLWGNGRALIIRNERGEPTSLVPLLPDRTHEEVIDGRLYHVTKVGAEDRVYPSENVLHVPGLSFDGLTGYSVFERARNSFGLVLASEKHGNRTMRNAARPSVVLQTPGAIDKADADKLLSDWARMHEGAENSGRTALLSRGITANALSVSNRDAEFLGLREFQRVEIANWFNLPPHKVGDSSRLSYNSIEQEELSYLNTTLMRWLVKWQEECDEKLLTEAEKASGEYYFEFITDAKLRADTLARYQAYQIAIASEIMSPNEARERENLPRRTDKGGDEFRNPNTRPATSSARPEPPPTNGHARYVPQN